MLRLAGVGANYSVFNKAIRLSTILSLQACLEIFSLCWGYSANAQIIKDESLGNEASRLTPNVEIKGLPADLIDGGATRGINLFHSFREFNIGNSQRVYFANPTGIENILTRITGAKLSNILGTLGVNGSANLFLINPSGIIFGENARLDLGGSFVASTANGVKFGEDGFFSTSSPEIPSQLLTINPSAFFFNQVQAGKIEHKSTAPLGNNFFGLRVQDGRSLLFVGGEINVDGGELDALGGRIELAAIANNATVGLNVDNNNLSLTVPDGVPRADISISDGAFIDVAGGGGGSIVVNAKNLNLKEGSILAAGIRSGLGTSDTQGGDVKINATDTVSIEGISNKGGISIFNDVKNNSVGNGGDISINAGSLLVTNAAQISTSTSGVGNAGSININTTEKVLFDGIGKEISSSGGALSRVRDLGIGSGGDISIQTNSLEVLNGAILSASTQGEGNAGGVKIQAQSVVFDGEDRNGLGSGAFSQVGSRGKGNAGGISITTNSLEVTNGAELSTSTIGEGNAGVIDIFATDKVLFDGKTSIGLNSGAFSRVDSKAKGNSEGGNILVTAGLLEIINQAQLDVSTEGEGNAGNILINSDFAKFSNFGRLDASTTRKGNAGNITINATNSVVLEGKDIPSFVSSLANPGASGKAGEIKINTSKLLMQDGSQIQTTNFGSNEGGNLTLNAESVELIGFFRTANGRFLPSGLFTSTEGFGDAGNLTVNTKVLLIKDGAEVQSSSFFGQGDGGDLIINATESLQLIGSVDNGRFGGLFTQSNGSGRAGDINIVTGSLLIEDDSNISAVTDNDASGNITVNSNTLEINSGGQLRTNTLGKSQAGDIILIVRDRITLAGNNSGIFARTIEGSTGNGGNIFIDPPRVTVQDGAKIAVDGQGRGVGGNVELLAGFLTLDNGQITAKTRTNNGGNIKLNLQELLLLRNGSEISTSAGNEQFGGNGGNININSPFIVAVPQEDSNITANAFSGNGGRVDITTKGIFGIQQQPELTDFSDITASSESGVDGQISIDNPDVDPSRGVEELPADVVNATGLINQNLCTAARQGSEFVVTGRGGLPASPGNVGNVNSTWEDWSIAGERETSKPKPVVGKNQAPKKSESTTPIVEAKGWVVDSNGDVIFTAFPAKVNQSGTWLHPLDCQSLRKIYR